MLYLYHDQWLGKPLSQAKKGGTKTMTKPNFDISKNEDEDGMTNEQLNALLETLAKRIEYEANSPAEAARIVREAKAES